MTFENENACLWKAGTLAKYINNSKFKCDNSDKDNILLENDKYSDNTSEILLTSIITINSNSWIFI